MKCAYGTNNVIRRKEEKKISLSSLGFIDPQSCGNVPCGVHITEHKITYFAFNTIVLFSPKNVGKKTSKNRVTVLDVCFFYNNIICFFFAV